MNELTGEEYLVLRYLLNKVENRHYVLNLLVDVVLDKYGGDKRHSARALGYSIKGLRSKSRRYKRNILQ